MYLIKDFVRNKYFCWKLNNDLKFDKRLALAWCFRTKEKAESFIKKYKLDNCKVEKI
jgi:hypothetical protein